MRRKYVQKVDPETGKSYLFEVSLNYVGRQRSLNDTNLLISERHYEGPTAQDGTRIDTRARHQEYMRQNDVTVASDFKQEWADAPAKRKREMDRGRRENIERAIHHLEGPT